jgi:Zn-dependent protease with chaperone function/uncharacterized tellurite resistance protein B-like protein
MDFFTAQEHARRSTGRLVVFFVLAVLSLIVMTNLLVMAVFGYFNFNSFQEGSPFFFDWTVFVAIGVGVVLVVSGGTLYKISALSGGGDAVAQMLGAQPIFADDGDLDHQRVVNVVEEMAIASGSPVPQVYLLKESGINAFAAGFSISDAVIAVTEGTVGNLNREQLQGVIAHEFSHILNGDMRLNIRLIGILHGILLLGLIGGQVLRGSSRSGRKGSGGGLLLGLGLVVIGYAGTFFGKLIKAAVSRQREFLADAAAIQFTRNPQGIGGALIRIGAGKSGSLLLNPRSEEISHAFFSQGVAVTFASLFATHPPLAERIKRILPDWDGTYPSEATVEGDPAAVPASAHGFSGQGATGLSGVAVMEQIGRPGDAQLDQARQLLRDIPEVLGKAARDPFAARALFFYLILDQDDKVRADQLNRLKSAADRGVYAETMRLIRLGGTLPREMKLALVELALPTLRRLSQPQYCLFLDNLEALIRADGKITLFEWCLRKIVVQHMEDYFGKPAGPGRPIDDPAQAEQECAMLLSTLVHTTRHEGMTPAEVFAVAAEQLGRAGIAPIPTERLGLIELDRSLKVLVRLSPQAKARLIKACVACVVADGRIDPAETELLRGVAAALAVPMPLLSIGGTEGVSLEETL